jgi:16S rRNA (guanine527-N7)-methyltransferase
VVRARAEECVGRLEPADIVTARAVAPLDRLAGWCLPLATVGGRILALKGATAAAELAEHAAALAKLGAGASAVRLCGEKVLAEPTTVVDIVRQREVTSGAEQRRKSGSRRRK